MKKGTVLKILNVIAGTILLLGVLTFVLPVFVCDQFRIGGESMSPTLMTGDHILVNKLLMGARIYTKYDFSGPDMECFRMPGLRKIRPGDVAVFNYPRGRNRKKIEFRINYVYAKRCIGCPGDSVSIVDGYYRNSRCPGIIGNSEMQEMLAAEPDSMIKEKYGTYMRAYTFAKGAGWTVRNFGPLYIPGKGDVIALNTLSARIYAQEIEYETGSRPEIKGGKVYLGGQQADTYRFAGNWYFFGGDNVLNSKDSRYIGLVPEDYIVGITTHVVWGDGKARFRRIRESVSEPSVQ